MCLSLLGTWSGEPWRPDISTLLQVFVSIQSMVFCDEPWCNEPGRENQVGSGPSLSYNRTIRMLTMEHAMLTWAKQQQDDPNKNGLWSEVVERHFRTNAKSMIERVKAWTKMDKPDRPKPTPTPEWTVAPNHVVQADAPMYPNAPLVYAANGQWMALVPGQPPAAIHPSYISHIEDHELVSPVGSPPPTPPQPHSPVAPGPSTANGKGSAGPSFHTPFSTAWPHYHPVKPMPYAAGNTTKNGSITADEVFGNFPVPDPTWGTLEPKYWAGWDSAVQPAYNIYGAPQPPSVVAPSPPSYSPTPTPSSGSDGEAQQHASPTPFLAAQAQAQNFPPKSPFAKAGTFTPGKYKIPPNPSHPDLHQPVHPPPGQPANWWAEDDLNQMASKQAKMLHQKTMAMNKAHKPAAPMPPGPKLPTAQPHKPHPLAQVQQADLHAPYWSPPPKKAKPKAPGPKQKYKLPPPQGLPMSPMTVQEFGQYKATLAAQQQQLAAAQQQHAAVQQQHAIVAFNAGSGPPVDPHLPQLTTHQQQTLKWLQAAQQQDLTEDEQMIWAPGGAPAEALFGPPAGEPPQQGAQLGAQQGAQQQVGPPPPHPGPPGPPGPPTAQFHQRRRRDVRDRFEAVSRELVERLEKFLPRQPEANPHGEGSSDVVMTGMRPDTP